MSLQDEATMIIRRVPPMQPMHESRTVTVKIRTRHRPSSNPYVVLFLMLLLVGGAIGFFSVLR